MMHYFNYHVVAVNTPDATDLEWQLAFRTRAGSTGHFLVLVMVLMYTSAQYVFKVRIYLFLLLMLRAIVQLNSSHLAETTLQLLLLNAPSIHSVLHLAVDTRSKLLEVVPLPSDLLCHRALRKRISRFVPKFISKYKSN